MASLVPLGSMLAVLTIFSADHVVVLVQEILAREVQVLQAHQVHQVHHLALAAVDLQSGGHLLQIHRQSHLQVEVSDLDLHFQKGLIHLQVVLSVQALAEDLQIENVHGFHSQGLGSGTLDGSLQRAVDRIWMCTD